MILDSAEEKIQLFNRIGVHYEATYHYVIRNRLKTEELFTPQFVDDITAGLISFDMQRMMGKEKYLISGEESWALHFVETLSNHEKPLTELKDYRLESIDLSNATIAGEIIYVFDDLAKNGPHGLNFSSSSKGFQVGASKILHFLIPDLFIIVDSNARFELAKHHGFAKHRKVDGKQYLSAMRLFQKELFTWAESNDDRDFSHLIALDPSWQQYCGERTVPLPRIIDKCTFSGDKPFQLYSYLPLELKAFIGGFMGPSFKVELFGDTLIHTEYGQRFEHVGTKKIRPTMQQWVSFSNTLNELGVWQWEDSYISSDVTDGTQWSVLIRFNDRKIQSRGENCYPGLTFRGAPDVTEDFNKLTSALVDLLGGLSFC